jgi:probable phosphoglycerate mutase
MSKVFFVRHGETDWNLQRRYQGSSDIALNSNGRTQANKLAPILAQKTISHVYCSDLSRVIETANLAGIPRDELILEPRMREIHFGKFEGLTHAEVAETYPDELQIWEDDRENNVHGGEKMSDVVARVGAFYEHLRDDYIDGEHILCFAHGGTIAIFLAIAMGVHPEKWWQFLLENTALTEINLYDTGSLLKKFNDTRHLD